MTARSLCWLLAATALGACAAPVPPHGVPANTQGAFVHPADFVVKGQIAAPTVATATQANAAACPACPAVDAPKAVTQLVFDPHCLHVGLCRVQGRCSYDPTTDNCVATEPRHCAQSFMCRDWGQCDNIDGYCDASSAGGCANHRACRLQGWCTAVGNVCRATTAQHCQQSYGCRDHGSCNLDPSGYCYIGSDTDCRQALRCRQRGDCHYLKHPQGDVGSICEPKLTSECAASVACTREGKCVFAEDTDEHGTVRYCATTPGTDCTALPTCIEDGNCTTTKGGSCIVGGDADCAKSEHCLRHGKCKLGPIFECEGPDAAVAAKP